MFSVIIPLYNKGFLIKRTIDSVLSQTFQDFEIVVVDDGSTDDSGLFVKEYKDERVKYYYKENGGVSSARNYGIDKASKEWIVFLDADDLLLPNALETFETLIRSYNNEVKIVSGKIIWDSNESSLELSLNKDKEKSYRNFYTKNPYFHLWKNDFYLSPRNVAIHNSIIKKYGGFDSRMSFYEDLEFFLRILKSRYMSYTDRPIAFYVQDGTGLSGTSHPIGKEFAYYIPELVYRASFWHKALLYENLEQQIDWWEHKCNDENVIFYKDMQKKYFPIIYTILHWIRQKMVRLGII